MNQRQIKTSLITLTLVASALPAFATKISFWQRLSQLNPFAVHEQVIVADDVSVELLNDADAPIKVLSAAVKDKGTSLLKMKGLEQAFVTKILNTSGKKLLAYQLVWQRHLPFEEYAEQDIRINSANYVKAGGEDTLEFRKPIHYRSDAFYKVFAAKVLYEDGTEWKSDRDFDVGGYWAEIKKQIEAAAVAADEKSLLIPEETEQNTDTAE
jgi:hypothetical protein